MARACFLFMVIVGVSAACGTSTSTQERRPEPSPRAAATEPAPATIAVPENAADRGIRRDLNLAIAQDPELKNRDISFIVTNGDVNVNGVVATEEERKKINDLAMSIGGVRSVANALRVGE